MLVWISGYCVGCVAAVGYVLLCTRPLSACKPPCLRKFILRINVIIFSFQCHRSVAFLLVRIYGCGVGYTLCDGEQKAALSKGSCHRRWLKGLSYIKDTLLRCGFREIMCKRTIPPWNAYAFLSHPLHKGGIKSNLSMNELVVMPEFAVLRGKFRNLCGYDFMLFLCYWQGFAGMQFCNFIMHT